MNHVISSRRVEVFPFRAFPETYLSFDAPKTVSIRNQQVVQEGKEFQFFLWPKSQRQAKSRW